MHTNERRSLDPGPAALDRDAKPRTLSPPRVTFSPMPSASAKPIVKEIEITPAVDGGQKGTTIHASGPSGELPAVHTQIDT